MCPYFYFLLHQLYQETTGYLSEQSCRGHVTPDTITQTKMESKHNKRSDCLLHIIHKIEWGSSIKIRNTLEFQAWVILMHEWKDDSCCPNFENVTIYCSFLKTSITWNISSYKYEQQIADECNSKFWILQLCCMIDCTLFVFFNSDHLDFNAVLFWGRHIWFKDNNS